MSRAAWDTLLAEVRHLHESQPALQGFCPFPTDLTPQEVPAHHIPASDLFQDDACLVSSDFAACTQALRDCSGIAHWRETYKGTDIADEFLNRFGCYGIIGPNGPFHSDTMRAWVVYMPAQLWYPWHHHPGEEIYFTLAGSAEFLAKGHPVQIMTEGATSQHASNQPHATETKKHPFLAYVVWRNRFETAPVLTPPEMLD